MNEMIWTPEEKSEMETYSGKEYLMEIFHEETKKWEKEKPQHYDELNRFLKKMTPEMINAGVGGIISRGVETMAKKRNIHPKKMMEILVTENAQILRIFLDEMIEIFIPKNWWKYWLLKVLSMECYQAKF